MGVRVGDIVRQTLWGSFTNGGRWCNVWYALCTGIVLPTTEIPDSEWGPEAVEKLEYHYSRIWNLQSAVCRYDYVNFYNVTRDVPMLDVSCPSSWNATRDVGQLASHAASMLLTYKTATKRCVGKKFIPGISENDLTDGLLPSASYNALLAMGIDSLDTFSSNGTPHGFTWRYGVNPVGTLAFAPFTSVRATTIPGEQRRRRPGIGI